MKTIKQKAPEGYTFGEFNKETSEVTFVEKPTVPELNRWIWIENLYPKQKDFESALIFFQGKNKDTYGFGFAKIWADTFGTDNTKKWTWRYATPDEVKERLIEEAKKRGFKKGVTVDRPSCFVTFDGFGLTKPISTIDGSLFELNKNKDSLKIGNQIIFCNGIWAEILEEEKEMFVVINQKEQSKFWGYINTENIEEGKYKLVKI